MSDDKVVSLGDVLLSRGIVGKASDRPPPSVLRSLWRLPAGGPIVQIPYIGRVSINGFRLPENIGRP